jgi:hypothetical protein
MEPTEIVLESTKQPDILDDEMTLKWGVSPEEFEALGKDLLVPFQETTHFSLILSGRIVPTNTYVNVWQIPNATAVHDAWAMLGKSRTGPFGLAYIKLNDMLLEEKQEILLALKEERTKRQGERVVYLRNRYWIESENLKSFIEDVQRSDWSDGVTLVGFGVAFTGKLNVFTVYLSLPAARLKIYPEPGAYSSIEEVLTIFDEMVQKKQIRFHSIRYRPSAPQVLVPSKFDPTNYSPDAAPAAPHAMGEKGSK